MRYFLIILETLGKERIYEILDNITDEAEAIQKLISHSNHWEHSITAGLCRVYMTTYVE